MSKEKFEDLEISKEVKKALSDLKHSKMFPIQAEAIPRLLAGEDVIGQAQTGTGKTAAFGIPIIERVDEKSRHVQAIVLVPTRELAVQVKEEIERLGKYKKLEALAVYGGVSINPQIDALKRGVQIVIGTPGRVIDHIKRGTLKLNKLKIFVLDEADRMLDMGFIDDIRYVLRQVPRARQTLLFSATMPDEILDLAENYMNKHHVIAVSEDELTVEDIEQVYVPVEAYNKVTALTTILEKEKVFSAIIFRNTKAGVDGLVRHLKHRGIKSRAIHGNFSQAKRNKVLKDFKAGKFDILIATDVAARGLDIKGVSHVINYDIPRDPKDYVHRIGRTGRAGQKGKAILFVTPKDDEELGMIRWYTDQKIEKADYDIPKRKNFKDKKSHPKKGRGQRGRRRDKKRHKHRGPNKYAIGEY